MDIIILIIFFLLVAAFFVFFTAQFYQVAFRGFAPFISTRKKVVEEIIANLPLNEKSVVYEFGCGKAGFLAALRKKLPQAELVGYEYSFLPYLIGRIQNSFQGSRLKILKENFFRVNIKKADVIYCYLSIKTMELLEPKFQKECKSGSLVVSYLFPLPNETPMKILNLKSRPEKVYIYKF